VSRVVGIDFSMTCTGIGILTCGRDGLVHADAATADSAGHNKDSLVQRRARLRGLRDTVLAHALPADLAVVEGVVTARLKGGSPLDRHYGWWLIVDSLIKNDVPVATVDPASLKLAVAGSGKADKAAVAIAIERLWPGLEVSSSDVSDAVGLAHLGAVHLGWDVKTLDRHRQVKAAWPVLPDPSADGRDVHEPGTVGGNVAS
jgi:crossover junction endodeoxyribonuclease RuvC